MTKSIFMPTSWVGITSEELLQLIGKSGDKSFEDWLKVHYETVLQEFILNLLLNEYQ